MHLLFTAKLTRLALIATIFSLPGCSPLSRPTSESGTKSHRYSPLSSLKMSPDMVALEIAVTTLNGQALKEFDQIWTRTDMQSLPLDVRRRLDQNGFRVGLLGVQLPRELTSALSWSQPLMTNDGEILFQSKSPLPPDSTSGSFNVKQIEQLNSGEQHWVPCSAQLSQVSWNVDSGKTSRSGICEQAQCGFELSQIPVGDNSIKMWLRPVIRHGETKLRYGIDQETLLMQEQQKRLRIDELDFAQRIRLGQTLVITTTTRPAGLGQQFFASGRFSSSRQVLLIRPVRIGQDDLFGPERTTRRLSTNLD